MVLRLGPVAPNPLREATTIGFALPREMSVTLSIHDVAGRVVSVLEDGPLPAGEHRRTWSPSGDRGPLGAGVYFVRLVTEDRTLTGKLVLTR